MRQRIEQLEKRQTQDDAVLCVVNRYWNQLNEDIRVLLQRFDAETADESENKSEFFYSDPSPLGPSRENSRHRRYFHVSICTQGRLQDIADLLFFKPDGPPPPLKGDFKTLH